MRMQVRLRSSVMLYTNFVSLTAFLQRATAVKLAACFHPPTPDSPSHTYMLALHLIEVFIITATIPQYSAQSHDLFTGGWGEGTVQLLRQQTNKKHSKIDTLITSYVLPVSCEKKFLRHGPFLPFSFFFCFPNDIRKRRLMTNMTNRSCRSMQASERMYQVHTYKPNAGMNVSCCRYYVVL